jgi:hypothetical protein
MIFTTYRFNMKNNIYRFLTAVALLLTASYGVAQTTAMDFNTTDCNGNPVHLFSDLDAGKAVVLFYYMPSCGSCPPPASKIQMMANNINATYPGMVKAYAFPYNNTTNCTYSSSWVSSNSLPLYAPMDSGAASVAYYGGFGMPSIVLLGGSDHRVMFFTKSWANSDTTEMRDSILNLLTATAIQTANEAVNAFQVYPNPASDQITVSLELKESGDLKVEIMDVAGRLVATLMDEKQNEGALNRQFNTAGIAAGNYWVRASINGKTSTQKLDILH